RRARQARSNPADDNCARTGRFGRRCECGRTGITQRKEQEMSVETAQDLFVEELKDIYSAEKQAIRAYPRLVKAVSSQALKEAMQLHLEQTERQLERLEQIFEQLEERPG